jgi:hypothetical protein
MYNDSKIQVDRSPTRTVWGSPENQGFETPPDCALRQAAQTGKSNHHPRNFASERNQIARNCRWKHTCQHCHADFDSGNTQTCTISSHHEDGNLWFSLTEMWGIRGFGKMIYAIMFNQN